MADESKLEKWARIIPDCSDFLINFFISCKGISIEDNLINYARDIHFYSKSDFKFSDSRYLLYKAFFDITGMKVYQG